MLAQYTRIISFEEENTISSDIFDRIQEENIDRVRIFCFP